MSEILRTRKMIHAEAMTVAQIAGRLWVARQDEENASIAACVEEASEIVDQSSIAVEAWYVETETGSGEFSQ